jgi:hypothetical protein
MTQPLPAEAVAALAAQQAAAQGTLTQRTLELLAGLWAAVTDPTDADQLRVFIARAATVLRSAELAVGKVTESYLRQVLGQLGVLVPSRGLVALPTSLRQGVPNEEVLARPPATVRYLRSVDTPPDAAAAAGATRLRAIAQTNLELALRQAAVDVFSKIEAVRGYRRILRPYLSEGGSCGLCIVAADRIYRTGELMPIHGKCKCSVLPVLRRGVDPGLQLNSDDLAQLYGDAGGNTAAKLKRTRYRIEQHGELGPVLVQQGHGFRTADQAADDLKRRRARNAERRVGDQAESFRRQLALFTESIPDLEARAAAGENVDAALTWQKARVAELRKLLAA